MTRRVVVTGIGMVSPVGLTRDETWKSLLAGRSGIDRISSFDPEDLDVHIAAEVKGFDPADYVSRKQAHRMDRFVQMAAAATLEAAEQSGFKVDANNAERVSAIVASSMGGIITLAEQVQVLETRGGSRVSPFLIPMMILRRFLRHFFRHFL